MGIKTDTVLGAAAEGNLPDAKRAKVLPVGGHSVKPSDDAYKTKPDVDGAKTFLAGTVAPWTGPTDPVTSPIIDEATGERAVIGKIARMSKEQTQQAVAAAEKAWDGGQGAWPQTTPAARVAALQRVVARLKERRSEIVNVLMWEICKTSGDAAAEFDRTMQFFEKTLETYRAADAADAGAWTETGGILHKVRRGPVGVTMIVGPFNYPFNETYATLIPALLMGNVGIMKLPAVGGLAHVLTMEAYAAELPVGTLQFLTGKGRETIPPVMESGVVDVLAFIGGSKAADSLLKQHPHPHRLRVAAWLEAKNVGVVTPSADLKTAVDQCVLGALSYNGQRCTAIKLILVHESLAKEFTDQLVDAVAALPAGLPWAEGVKLTPLPEPAKPKYLGDLIEDAKKHGAAVVNAAQGGGACSGGLYTPAILAPVSDAMKVWHEEQFGPVIPVATYKDPAELRAYLRTTPYGQQASIFTTSTGKDTAELLDMLATVVTRVNVNTQCGRSPDVLAFAGRRSSANATMSVSEALKLFSVETVVAAQAKGPGNEGILKSLDATSGFLEPLPAAAK
jgi:glyceraldehyde-3-phosphate dehydrogenase (NADP+)